MPPARQLQGFIEIEKTIHRIPQQTQSCEKSHYDEIEGEKTSTHITLPFPCNSNGRENRQKWNSPGRAEDGIEGRKEGAAAARPLNSVNGEVRRESDAMEAVAPAITAADIAEVANDCGQRNPGNAGPPDTGNRLTATTNNFSLALVRPRGESTPYPPLLDDDVSPSFLCVPVSVPNVLFDSSHKGSRDWHKPDTEWKADVIYAVSRFQNLGCMYMV